MKDRILINIFRKSDVAVGARKRPPIDRPPPPIPDHAKHRVANGPYKLKYVIKDIEYEFLRRCAMRDVPVSLHHYGFACLKKKGYVSHEWRTLPTGEYCACITVTQFAKDLMIHNTRRVSRVESIFTGQKRTKKYIKSKASWYLAPPLVINDPFEEDS